MQKTLLNSAELADLFSISIRQVQRLTLNGTLSPVSDQRPYRYKLETACSQYCAFLHEKIVAREKKEAVAELEQQRLQAEVDMKRAKADAAVLELSELRGKLHRAEDVEAITPDHVLFFRSMLVAMPGKLAVDCANCKTAAEAAERIKKEVYFILDNLTEYRYDPDEHKRRVREWQGWAPTGAEETE